MKNKYFISYSLFLIFIISFDSLYGLITHSEATKLKVTIKTKKNNFFNTIKLANQGTAVDLQKFNKLLLPFKNQPMTNEMVKTAESVIIDTLKTTFEVLNIATESQKSDDPNQKFSIIAFKTGYDSRMGKLKSIIDLLDKDIQYKLYEKIKISAYDLTDFKLLHDKPICFETKENCLNIIMSDIFDLQK